MFDRRDFIKHAVVTALATSASTNVQTQQDNRQPAAGLPQHIDIAIYDEDFADSVAFKDALVALGAEAHSVQKDLGRLWHGQLGASFSRGVKIAGLTTHSDLFVCQSFAKLQGACLRFEGEHDCRGTDWLTHTLSLPDAHIATAQSLTKSNEQWPKALANELHLLANVSLPHEVIKIHTQTKRHDSHPGSLFSWLIA